MTHLCSFHLSLLRSSKTLWFWRYKMVQPVFWQICFIYSDTILEHFLTILDVEEHDIRDAGTKSARNVWPGRLRNVLVGRRGILAEFVNHFCPVLEHVQMTQGIEVGPQFYSVKSELLRTIQCVSVDSASLIIYPEIKATEVPFFSWNTYLCSFTFRITKLN